VSRMASKSSSRLGRPKVVVVGGSFAGLATVRHLVDECDVCVIEPRDYFEYTPGACHLLSGSGSYSDLLSPLSQVARGATHERGYFVGVKPDAKKVVVRRGESSTLHEIPFDALVLCSGLPYQAPIRAAASSFTERIEEIERYKSRVEGSKNIVIVGGGLVGVELAAEFAVRLKHKPKISIISRSSLLLTLPSAAGKIAQKWFSRHGVQLLLDDEISEHKSLEQTVVTKNGVTMPVDLLVDCTGRPSPQQGGAAVAAAAAAAAAASSGLVSPYSKDGLVLVDDNLRAVQFGGETAVFAAGDVVEHQTPVGFAVSTGMGGGLFGAPANRPFVRNAHLAESQAEVCAANIRRFFATSGAATTSTSSSIGGGYVRYPQDVFGAPLNPLLSCVSLGPNNAIVVFNGIVVGGAILGVLAALVKFTIERTKISEIRQQSFGRAFWAFGHVVVNFTHSLWVWLRLGLTKKNQRKVPVPAL